MNSIPPQEAQPTASEAQNGRSTPIDRPECNSHGRKAANNTSASPGADTIESLKPVKLWHESVNGEDLLDALAETINRHVVLTPEQVTAVSLWTVLTYLLDAAQFAPILAVSSPTKACGKTTLLELIQKLSNASIDCTSITPAVLFRCISLYHPVLFIDEMDKAFFANDEVRTLINSGHKRAGAQVLRCVGDTYEPKVFSTWALKLLAKIGKFPDTIESRSILIEMQRKMPSQRVKSLRFADFTHLRSKAARWASDHFEDVEKFTLDTPPYMDDRSADNWESLFAIAETAGGGWPQLAEQAARKLSGREDGSLPVKLLADIKQVTQGMERITTESLLSRLNELKDAPWSESGNQGLTAHKLSGYLSGFGIKPKPIRFGEVLKRGYKLDAFEKAYSRYVQSVTPLQSSASKGFRGGRSVTEDGSVTDCNGGITLNLKDCFGVTLQGTVTDRCDCIDFNEGIIDELIKGLRSFPASQAN